MAPWAGGPPVLTTPEASPGWLREWAEKASYWLQLLQTRAPRGVHSLLMGPRLGSGLRKQGAQRFKAHGSWPKGLDMESPREPSPTPGSPGLAGSARVEPVRHGARCQGHRDEREVVPPSRLHGVLETPPVPVSVYRPHHGSAYLSFACP